MSESRPSAGAATDASYPGERLGLPQTGPGAVAGWGRRILALFVDWFACLLVLGVFFGGAVWTGGGWAQWGPMLLFLVEASVLTALIGGSFGQLVCGVGVARLDGRPVNLLQAFARTFLICLVVPPLVFNRDQRGLHDLAVKTVTVRRR